MEVRVRCVLNIIDTMNLYTVMVAKPVRCLNRKEYLAIALLQSKTAHSIADHLVNQN